MNTRLTLAAALIAVALALAACGSPPGPSANANSGPSKPPPLPSKPVSLTVLDVSGDLTSTKVLIQNFAKENPKVVSSVKFLIAKLSLFPLSGLPCARAAPAMSEASGEAAT